MLAVSQLRESGRSGGHVMKPAIIASAVAGTLLAAWGLAVPYVVGLQTEAKMKSDLAASGQFGALPANAVLESFERGWFRSTARTVYSFPAGESLWLLRVTHHIDQFALPLLHWSRTDYDLALQDGNGAITPLPLSAHGVKRFSGETEFELTAPTLEWSSAAGGHVSGKGIAFKLHGKKGEPAQYTFDAPELAFTLPGPAGQPLTMALRQLGVTGSGSGNEAQGAAVPWVQQSHTELAALELKTGQTSLMQWNKLALDTRLKDNGDNIDLIYQSRLDNGHLGSSQGAGLSDVRLDFSYHRLDKQALLKWQADSRALYNQRGAIQATGGGTQAVDAAARRRAEIQVFSAALKELARHSPGFSIDRLSFRTPHGDVTGTLDVNVDGKQPQPDLAEPNDVLLTVLRQATSGKGTLKVARSLLAGDSGVPLPGDKLQQLLGQGLVKDDGRYLSADLSFGRNGLLINGKSLPSGSQLPAAAPAPVPSMPLTPAPAVPPPPAPTRAIPTPAVQVPVALSPELEPAKPAAVRKVVVLGYKPDYRRDLRRCLDLADDNAVAACAANGH